MGRGVPSLRMRAHEWVLRGGVSATAARVRRRLRRGAQTVWPYPRRLRCSRGSSDITAKRRDAQAQPNKGFIFKLQRTSRDEKSYLHKKGLMLERSGDLALWASLTALETISQLRCPISKQDRVRLRSRPFVTFYDEIRGRVM